MTVRPTVLYLSPNTLPAFSHPAVPVQPLIVAPGAPQGSVVGQLLDDAYH